MIHLRIFPRKTKATPLDSFAIINRFPNIFDIADKISISVTFTYDIPISEKLYNAWKYVAPCSVGGPAFNSPSGSFESGLFLKKGYLITSRGCNNNCWFCSVPVREGQLREINISDGYNVLDDNFLSCSYSHQLKVFEVLKKYPYKVSFTGGLEARLLTQTISDHLFRLKPKVLYFAYDPGDNLEELNFAMSLLLKSGFKKSNHNLKCYVLIGYDGDNQIKAYDRLKSVYNMGFIPMSMLYRDHNGIVKSDWISFNRNFANPFIVTKMFK